MTDAVKVGSEVVKKHKEACRKNTYEEEEDRLL